MESKLKVGPSSSILNTYTPHFIASPFFESFKVSGPDFYASAHMTSSQLLLQNKTTSELFSETMKEYGRKMTELSKRIMEIVLMIMGEGFGEKFYESEFAKCHGYLRIINYSIPTMEEEEEEEEGEVEGLGMHTDMSCITIVYQDEVGGLQVRSKEGKWMDIKACEGRLVVNIGDLMQAWSNGKLRSSQHRVVLKKRRNHNDNSNNYVKKKKNRFSVAFFWCFEDEKVIYAPDEVVGEGGFRVYKPFLCSDYLKFRQSSERGRFEKVGYTAKDFAGI
ncbi:Gibberellin 20-oxidase-like protein [Senna tora]|uniref:Gibberellin 20-oxidase-like protein n=1 Tax=Senna tora TaxID=362788 RepID=A0A834X0T3_9FABA|nr:Gibberellin 20-oxidase-like protein [Senna tora]